MTVTPLAQIITSIRAALALLPPAMTSLEAWIMLLAIGWQESRFLYRRQKGNGPARGFWQFELGSRLLGGGVWGVYKHKASSFWLSELCKARGVAFEPRAIYDAIEFDDVLAAGVARLLLFTDPKRLPQAGDQEGAWVLYAKRAWRPGKPHPETWPAIYSRAVATAVTFFKGN